MDPVEREKLRQELLDIMSRFYFPLGSKEILVNKIIDKGWRPSDTSRRTTRTDQQPDKEGEK